MAVSHRTVISFGLVAIPVALYTAVRDGEIHLNQLHREDQGRVRYQKTCARCGREIAAGEIVKGFEYDKGRYVAVTDEELEQIKTEREKSIRILHFAHLDQISPVFYDKTYQVVPEPGGEKAFELLRAALMREGKIAVGKTVLGAKDTLMAIIPREDGMLLSTMYYEDDVKELPKSYPRPETSDQELSMARSLIQSMDAPFEPRNYRDEYQERLRALIEAKLAGREIPAGGEIPADNVIGLMEALKASIDQARAERRQA